MNNLIEEFKKLRTPKGTEILTQMIHIHSDLTKNSQQSLKNEENRRENIIISRTTEPLQSNTSKSEPFNEQICDEQVRNKEDIHQIIENQGGNAPSTIHQDIYLINIFYSLMKNLFGNGAKRLLRFRMKKELRGSR